MSAISTSNVKRVEAATSPVQGNLENCRFLVVWLFFCYPLFTVPSVPLSLLFLSPYCFSLPTVPLSLCSHCSSVPTVPLFLYALCAYCSSLPTASLSLLSLNPHCSSSTIPQRSVSHCFHVMINDFGSRYVCND